MHRKGARWVRRKAARKRPTPDHRERDLAAQPILLPGILGKHRAPRSPTRSSRAATPTTLRSGGNRMATTAQQAVADGQVNGQLDYDAPAAT